MAVGLLKWLTNEAAFIIAELKLDKPVFAEWQEWKVKGFTTEELIAHQEADWEMYLERTFHIFHEDSVDNWQKWCEWPRACWWTNDDAFNATKFHGGSACLMAVNRYACWWSFVEWKGRIIEQEIQGRTAEHQADQCLEFATSGKLSTLERSTLLPIWQIGGHSSGVF